MSAFADDENMVALNDNMVEQDRIIAMKIMGVKTGAELIPIINSRAGEGWRTGARGDEKAATWDRVYHFLFPDGRDSGDADEEEQCGKVFSDPLSSWSYAKLSDEEKVMVQHSLILIENKLITGTDSDYMTPFLQLKKRVLGGRRSKLLGIGNRKSGVSREVAQDAFDANMCSPCSDPIYQAQVSWHNIGLSYKNCASQIFLRGLSYLRKHTSHLPKSDSRAAGLLQKNMTLNRAKRADVEYFWTVAGRLTHIEKCQFIRELMFDKTKMPYIMSPAAVASAITGAVPAPPLPVPTKKGAKKGTKRDAEDVTEAEEPASPQKKGKKGKAAAAAAAAAAASSSSSAATSEQEQEQSAAVAAANSAKAAMFLAALTAHNQGTNKLPPEQFKAVNEKYIALLLEA
jgi:hypothetical protein